MGEVYGCTARFQCGFPFLTALLRLRRVPIWEWAEPGARYVVYESGCPIFAAFFAAKVGWSGEGVPVWERAVALSRDAHLSDDETVAKMGHPDVGRPPSQSQDVGLRPELMDSTII